MYRASRSGPAVTALILVTAMCAALIGGCGEDGPSGPATPVSWAHIGERTHLVDAPDGSLELVRIVDSTYYFRFTGLHPRIEEGDIIVGTAGDGYVRLVTDAAVSGQEMILRTSRARLTDAIVRGGTEAALPIGFGSLIQMSADAAYAESGAFSSRDFRPSSYVTCAEGAALLEGGIDLSGLVLFEEEISGHTASIEIVEGYVEFNPTAHLGLLADAGDVSRIESRVDGTFLFDCDISVDIPEPILLEGELPIAAARRKIVHYMGAFPVVAVVELDFMLGYRFSGSYAGGCSARFEQATDLSLGALYERGRWTETTDCESASSGLPLSCAEYSNAEMLVSMRPRVRIRLFGERLSDMSLEADDRFTVETETPPVWQWSMVNELRGTFEIDPDIIAPEPAGSEIEPLLLTETLGSGPYRTDYYIFVLMWGSEGEGDHQFAYPRGSAVDASGNIYVVDSGNNRVQKFAPDSTFIMKWGAEGSGDGQFLVPVAVAVDALGYIYVTDGGNDRVQKFGQGGEFVTSWGGSGSGPDEFDSPAGIAVGPSGDIYIADSGNHRVQRFTNTGGFVASWGSYGTAPGEFDTPIGITADGSGNIYVTECRNHRVQTFSSSGEPLALWGSYGTGEGEFDCPIAVTVDDVGHVYVVDYGNNRIQKLTSAGTVVTILGISGIGEGEFDRPEGIAIDESGFLFVVDSRNSRIQKFAPLH